MKNAAGFLNLPEWQEKFQKILSNLDRQDLLRSPVLGAENVENPWVAFDEEDFFSAIDTGIVFDSSHRLVRFPEKLITADTEIAIQRIADGHYQNTFFKAAVGATFPILQVLASKYASSGVEKIISQNDSVSGFILSRMESKLRSIEDSTYEAQWEKAAPSNPNPHLHGTVTRNRLVLQIAETLGCFVKPDLIPTTGIGSLAVEDVRIADSLGYSIRLLGMAQKSETSLQAVVEPCLIPSKYFLAQARGGSEIIYVQTKDGQSQIYACPGTSCEAISRGILSDLENCNSKANDLKIIDKVDNFVDRRYVRFDLMNLTDTLSQVLNIFSQNGIDIKSVIQPEVEVSCETKGGVSRCLVLIIEKSDPDVLKGVLSEINDKVKLASVVSSFRLIR